MRGLLAVARRELLAYFLSPIAWTVLALFLFLEGFQLVLFLRFLSQPSAPHGQVMQYLFGGTILYWVGVILVAALLPMRLLAEERRSGTLETLLTAPVGSAGVVVGKWLAAVAVYAALWAPTLAYVAILYAVSPAGGGPDPGTVASTYLGTLAVGAAFLAVGLWASSLTSNQVIAAVTGFVLLLALVLVGALRLFPSSPWEGRLLDHVNLLAAMEDLARGIADTRPFVYLAGLTALALYAAVETLDWSVRRAARPWGGAGLALAALLVVMANYLGARHYLRGDWTRARVHALAPRTRALVGGLAEPVEVDVLWSPPDGESAALAADVREILARMQAASDRLSVRWIDEDLAPAEARRLRARWRLRDVDLARGVVLFAAGGRSRVVTADDLADYRDDLEYGGQRIEDVKAEGAFDAALLAVTRGRAPIACFTSGHDELGFDAETFGGDFGGAARALARDGYSVETLDRVSPTALASCDLVVAAGAKRPFARDELGALDRYLAGGGRLLALLDASDVLAAAPDRQAAAPFPSTGLEPLLLHWGVRVRPAVAIDPAQRPAEDAPVVWQTARGYGEGAIGRALADRLTRHALAQVVEPAPRDGVEAWPILRTGEGSWGEARATALQGAAPLAFDAGVDLPGPVSIAMAAEARAETAAAGLASGAGKPARVVVFGDALSFVSRALDAEADYDADLLLSACAWLTGQTRLVDVGARVPEQLKLSLAASRLRRIAWGVEAGLPLAALLGAFLVFWRRRS